MAGKVSKSVVKNVWAVGMDATACETALGHAVVRNASCVKVPMPIERTMKIADTDGQSLEESRQQFHRFSAWITCYGKRRWGWG